MSPRRSCSMYCPECSSPMTQLMDRRRTIVYDYCWDCRGIWLENGDLQSAKHGESKTVKKLFKKAEKELSERKNMKLINYPLRCPSCQTGRLVDRDIGSITVQECEHCEGKFLSQEDFCSATDPAGSVVSMIQKLKRLIGKLCPDRIAD